MSKKLDLAKSLEIVQMAVQDMIPNKTLGLEDSLAKILPDEADRKNLRVKIQRLVHANHLDIRVERIPIDPHVTIDKIRREITHWSALPGEPGIPDRGPQLPPDGPLEDEPEIRIEHDDKKFEQEN
jgi:hypothetical protein